MPRTGIEPLELNRSVLEPIHGLIRLTNEEVNVIDGALFQRLRRIKQNGLLYLVFPAATHTRFEHSLGALFVANAMLENLRLNSRVAAAKGTVRKVAEAGPGDAIGVDGFEGIHWLQRVVRLAALVHDLGHGPLSHTFDSFAPTRTALREVLEDSRLEALWPMQEVLIRWGLKPGEETRSEDELRVPHEVMSCVLFALLWSKQSEESDIVREVTATILGQTAIAVLPSELAREWLPLAHDMIASAPADADRMDYLERDSRCAGVNYGLFDRNRILKTLLAYKDESGQIRLGLKASGLSAVENLMQARFELYVQVYYHKTNRAVSLMLKQIAAAAREEKTTLFPEPSLDLWVDTYLELSDDHFIRVLRGRGDVGVPTRVKKLAEEIYSRKLWKRIYDYRAEEQAERLERSLKGEFGEELVYLDKIEPQATKDLDGGARLLERGANGVYSVLNARSWLDAPLIQAMKESEDQFVRIYLKDADSSKARLMRDKAREFELQQENGDVGEA